MLIVYIEDKYLLRMFIIEMLVSGECLVYSSLLIVVGIGGFLDGNMVCVLEFRKFYLVLEFLGDIFGW